MVRRCILLLSSLVMGLSLQPAHSQGSWPLEPIKLVVAYPPGGSTDTAARILAQRLSQNLNQQVVVDNRAGAGGTIGAASVARAKPDGYTILLAASPEVAIAPVVMEKMNYDPKVDLEAISMVGQVPFVLVVNPALPVKTLQELIEYGKKNPTKLNYSSFGTNTSNHLIGEQFKILTGIKATHVPYKGSGPSITDLMGGQVQYTFDTATAVMGHVEAGKLRAIAVATPERLANAPTIPTMSEAGLPGFVGGTWFGLLAPANTPPDVIQRLNKETRAALASKDIQTKFAELNILPAGDSPAEFRAFIDAEIAKWKKLTAQLDLTSK
ncbi:Bug family tripartite tricarboxylate transporter substrate binding protein [Parapusillimonas granuli]|mgnify:CR=1 FL=1|uniref:Tripartite tricarboxylate transporter substrate binding protein n=1 Tax=Parapusillimonas granuli TaxID=380911 RepID=A0A853G412_9BURK|nr:tripartite tricarboxylate transporter substrate binding protein [Parapusillimonas granuli]MBB5215583.1 tripartite-type tricarboxylate transporter receptor subunit TctC [Parapusillimonas granuli]NYT49750.1 tripartite tricarboxylate transporter substrate binding protein [Parapusillimonas granuli]